MEDIPNFVTVAAQVGRIAVAAALYVLADSHSSSHPCLQQVASQKSLSAERASPLAVARSPVMGHDLVDGCNQVTSEAAGTCPGVADTPY